jgi:hypothetical protein
MPWDGRIHSAGKSKVQSSGTWKLKRGVDKAFVAQVRAEYLAAPAIDARLAPATPIAETPAPVTPPAPPAVAPEPPAVEDQTPAGYKMTEAADGIPYESYIDEGWTKEQLIETGIMVAVEAVLSIQLPRK